MKEIDEDDEDAYFEAVSDDKEEQSESEATDDEVSIYVVT
jgi:hypothetical protein